MKTRIHALPYLVRKVMPIINNVLSRVLFPAAKGGVAKVAALHIVHSLWTPKQLYGFHGTILLSWHNLTLMAQSYIYGTILLSWHNLTFMAQSYFHGTILLSQHNLTFMAQSYFHNTILLSWHNLTFMAQSYFHGTILLLFFITFNVSELHTLLVTYYN